MVVCEPKSCQYHQLTDNVMEDLKTAVEKITDSQMQVKETMIKLVEGFKAVDRLEGKVDKFELLQREKDRVQDERIDELRVFMYKSIGLCALALPAISILTQLLVVH